MIKKILGVLNLTKYSKLGELLFFIENLKIKKHLTNIENIELAIISQDNQKLFSVQLPLIYNYLNIDACFLFSSLENFNDFLKKEKYDIIFPAKQDYEKYSNPLDSILIIKDFFSKNQFLPILQSKPEIKNFCRDFFEKYAKQKTRVVVHLKNSGKQEESNANQIEWHNFFQYCNKNKKNIVFFLIGNELIAEEISSLPNIILTKDKNLNIVQELALIEQADLFMGMCSGPFQAALFSRKPYLVFKNPEHDKEKMNVELSFNKFPFSLPNQIFIRKHETFDLLLKNFNDILK